MMEKDNLDVQYIRKNLLDDLVKHLDEYFHYILYIFHMQNFLQHWNIRNEAR